MEVVIVTSIICPMVSLNLCRPIKFYWDHTTLNGSCYNENAFYEWGSFPNIITDIVILVLPVPLVWKLQTLNNKKVGLTLNFLTASM